MEGEAELRVQRQEPDHALGTRRPDPRLWRYLKGHAAFKVSYMDLKRFLCQPVC